MKWFKERGWDVDVAAAGDIHLPFTDNKYNIPIERSPFHRSNLTAYKQLKAIIKENRYNIIHCHTPLGGVLARLAARQARKHGTRVIYTAHGFHFFKGASIIHWLIYYPIEKQLSRYTDILITINKEDYQLAKTHGFKAKSIEQVHGVGVDTEKFQPIETNEKVKRRESFGYRADDFLIFYAAEFNRNKNQQLLLKVMHLLKGVVPRAKLLLAGEGELLEDCKALTEKLHINHMVDFIGFRSDLQEWMPMCDMAVASSLREGLPVNVMEAMACGLPVVAVANRGHRELVEENRTGWVVPCDDPAAFADKIKMLAEYATLKNQLGKHGREAIVTTYSTDKILAEKSRIYTPCMKDREETMWLVQ
jgi:glycosyltransferase EpsD